MTIQAEQTIGQWLESLTVTNSSSERDDAKMQNLLHRIGFPAAICICGIVYLEGQGTIEAPLTDIHSMAKMLVKRANKGG